MTISEDFVAWAWSLKPHDLPDEVRERAALHLLDTIGVALAGRRLRASPFAAAAAGMFGLANEASVIGEGVRTSAAAAALANGMLMHGLDYDDTHTGALVHASAATVPAALAVGEQLLRAGREVLHGIVIGYELIGRLGAATPHGFHARGFHATSVCGAVSAALVAARLDRASEAEAAQALGIAGSFSSGSLEFLSTGATTKQLHPGWACMAGTVAARLARNGATGPTTILEGKYGIYALFTDQTPNLDCLTADLGRKWQVEGIAVKSYPACHLMHATLDAAAALRNLVDVQQIKVITVRIPRDSIPIVAAPQEIKVRPRTSYEAKFSVQWSLAAMLRDGLVNVDTFDLSQLARPDIVTLSERVNCEAAEFSGPAADAPGDLTVELYDGRRIRSADVPAKPGLRSQVMAKFRAATGVSPDLTEELIAAVIGIDEAPDLSRLFGLLSRAGQEQSNQTPPLSAAV